MHSYGVEYRVYSIHCILMRVAGYNIYIMFMFVFLSMVFVAQVLGRVIASDYILGSLVRIQLAHNFFFIFLAEIY